MKDQKRGRNLALLGAGLQVVLTVGIYLIGRGTSSLAAGFAVFFLAGGTFIWLMAALLFYCRQLELQEEAELAYLASRAEQSGIFDRREELELRPARGRRIFVEKWLVPAFTVLLAAYLAALAVPLIAGIWFLPVVVKFWSLFGFQGLPPVVNIGRGLLFSALGGFLAFLFSRYCTGMSSRPQWRYLRAPASYLLVCTVLVGAAAAGLGFAWWGYRGVDIGVAVVVPILHLVLALELLVNFVLDLFRPRVPGQEQHLSFDSRLFALLAEPSRVGHSIAETLNYQFGFEVSRTWFYRLLSKALVPLMLFAAAVLFLETSLVIVYQGHQCVVLHWGRRDTGRLLGPGLHVKWPWPIDTAEDFDVSAVREMRLGVGGSRKPVVIKGHEIRLWTQKHGRYEELDFLVAIPPELRARRLAAGTAGHGAQPVVTSQAPPPVNIIKLVVSVLYRVRDVYKFGYRFIDASRLLEDAAYREMVRYCASATLDTEVGGDANRPEAIMTTGWAKASDALAERIRKAVGPGGLDLGVEIVRVKLIAVHPPAKAAKDFEAVLAAERGQDKQRYQAEGAANQMLSAVAGDASSALELALAITRLEQFESLSGLKDNPPEFTRAVDGYIRRSCEQLQLLHREILREALLGKLPAGRARGQVGGRAAAIRKALAQRQGPLPPDVRRLIQRLLDGGVPEQAFSGTTAPQRLAEMHLRHLLELLHLRQLGVAADLERPMAEARRLADAFFDRAMGEPAREVARAGAYRITREMSVRAEAEAFQRQILAYRASPNMYMFDRWLDVWDDVLPGMKKYVLGVDRDRVEVWMNWERQREVLEGAFQPEQQSQ
ncbi:MAG: hypothetical protein J7M21_06645 [Planctomycetes bacterium]|nr:hypothetical protein [Planctomycetota bacterium]